MEQFDQARHLAAIQATLNEAGEGEEGGGIDSWEAEEILADMVAISGGVVDGWDAMCASGPCRCVGRELGIGFGTEVR